MLQTDVRTNIQATHTPFGLAAGETGERGEGSLQPRQCSQAEQQRTHPPKVDKDASLHDSLRQAGAAAEWPSASVSCTGDSGELTAVGERMESGERRLGADDGARSDTVEVEFLREPADGGAANTVTRSHTHVYTFDVAFQGLRCLRQKALSQRLAADAKLVCNSR